MEVDVDVDGQIVTVYLVDDGTLDTVIEVSWECGEVSTYRYSQELAADYREEDGTLDLKTFVEDVVTDDIYEDEMLDTG